MEKENLPAVAQLMSSIKDTLEDLKKAYREKDPEKLEGLKKEILSFHSKIGELL